MVMVIVRVMVLVVVIVGVTVLVVVIRGVTVLEVVVMVWVLVIFHRRSCGCGRRCRRSCCRRCRNSYSRSISDACAVTGAVVGHLVADDPLVSGIGVGRLRPRLGLGFDSASRIAEDGVGADLLVVRSRVFNSLRSKPFKGSTYLHLLLN